MNFLSILRYLALLVFLAVPLYFLFLRPKLNKGFIGKAALLNRVYWAAVTSGVLAVGFLICRYIVYERHGNLQWSVVMLIFGLAAIIIAAFFGAKKVMVSSVCGYIIGCIIGLLFNYEIDITIDGVLAQQKSTWWSIWTFTYIAIILISVILEIIIRRRNRRRDERL